MISAASVFSLPRWPWIPLSSLIGFDASTNYRFQFFVMRKSKWSVLGGCFNAEEKDGIAVPAVLLLGRDRRFRLIMIEGVATRVRAADLLKFLRSYPTPANSANDMPSNAQHQRVIFPSLVDFGRAIWNSFTKL